METWPVDLPDPGNSFSSHLCAGIADIDEQINSQRIRTYPERSSIFTLLLTQIQFETLRTFYQITLNNGGKLFEADWLVDIGFTFHRLRFLKPGYTANLQDGMHWDVNMNLEIVASVPFDSGNVIYWTCP